MGLELKTAEIEVFGHKIFSFNNHVGTNFVVGISGFFLDMDMSTNKYPPPIQNLRIQLLSQVNGKTLTIIPNIIMEGNQAGMEQKIKDTSYVRVTAITTSDSYSDFSLGNAVNIPNGEQVPITIYDQSELQSFTSFLSGFKLNYSKDHNIMKINAGSQTGVATISSTAMMNDHSGNSDSNASIDAGYVGSNSTSRFQIDIATIEDNKPTKTKPFPSNTRAIPLLQDFHLSFDDVDCQMYTVTVTLDSLNDGSKQNSDGTFTLNGYVFMRGYKVAPGWDHEGDHQSDQASATYTVIGISD